MSAETLSPEERILRMMKKVLTNVARDTYTPPGLKHPLTEETVMGIRDCLGAISARERELAEAAGRPMNMRPHFIDEKPAVTPIDISQLKKKNKDEGKH